MILFKHQLEKRTPPNDVYEETLLDINDDWWLIEASFQNCYGINLEIELENMSFRRFNNLLIGLPSTSALIENLRYRKENGLEKGGKEKLATPQDIMRLMRGV